MSNVVPCTAMGLLKTTVDPKRYNTLPPNQYAQPTFSKRVDVIGNIIIKDDALLLYEKVPTQSGLIVWMPSQGVQTIHRFGYVEAGTQSSGAAQGLTVNVGIGTQYVVIGPDYGPFRFNKTLAIPYNSLVSSDVLTVTPTMQTDTISVARLYTGRLRVQSDTMSLSAVALTGYLTGTATGDVRNIFNADVTDSYSSANMVQVATTANDAVKEISISKGIVSLIGPDIAQFFSKPNADKTEAFSPGQQYKPDALKGMATAFNSTILKAGESKRQYVGWITPWDIEIVQVQHPEGWTIQNIKKGSGNNGGINPFGGCLDVSVQFNVQPLTAMPLPQGHETYQEQWTVEISNTYATVSSDGGIYYTTVKEYTNCGSVITPVPAAPPTPVHCYAMTAHNNPRARATGGFNSANPTISVNTISPNGPDACSSNTQNMGMYLGSMVVIIITNIGSADGSWNHSIIYPVPPAPPVGTPPTVPHYNGISCRSNDDGASGELGPCRAIRYDGMAPGSLLRVDGLFMAECVPGYLTAPFTQSGETMSHVCENINAMSFLSFAYNTPESPFQRTYAGDEYDDFVRSVIPAMGTRQLRQFASNGLVRAAAAAGILNEPTCETLEHETGTVVQTAIEKKRMRVNGGDGIEDLNDLKSLRSIAPAVRSYIQGTVPMGIPGYTSQRLNDLDSIMAPIERERTKQAVLSQRQAASSQNGMN